MFERRYSIPKSHMSNHFISRRRLFCFRS